MRSSFHVPGRDKTNYDVPISQHNVDEGSYGGEYDGDHDGHDLSWHVSHRHGSRSD